MSDFDDELQEIMQSVVNTKTILQETINKVDFAIDFADENASNDTFYYLVEMLRKLRVDNNICIETLVEEAMQDK